MEAGNTFTARIRGKKQKNIKSKNCANAQAVGGKTMKNVMNYNGYVARIEFNERDNIFVGKVIGTTDSITFHGETVKELKADFHGAINHYIADYIATGQKPLKVVPAN